jgi:hypothetical protein
MPSAPQPLDTDKTLTLLRDDGRDEAERRRLVQLMKLVAALPPPPGAERHFPRYEELMDSFVRSANGDDGDALEESFLELYAHLHMHEAPYTGDERRTVNVTGGYWSHAGGLSPILRAGPWLRPDSVTVDLGAGNGLQGLLLQRLYPHRRCCQIEISSVMVDIGHRLQRWLGVAEERVEWRVADVLDTPLGGWDFVYLYRPVRPDGPGGAFYERLAGALAAEQREVVIFSIADCLSGFLPDSFDRFFTDGHLTCYRKKGP